MATSTPARTADPQPSKAADRRITLDELLRDLVADQLVTKEAAESLLATKSL